MQYNSEQGGPTRDKFADFKPIAGSAVPRKTIWSACKKEEIWRYLCNLVLVIFETKGPFGYEIYMLWDFIQF